MSLVFLVVITLLDMSHCHIKRANWYKPPSKFNLSSTFWSFRPGGALPGYAYAQNSNITLHTAYHRNSRDKIMCHSLY